MRFLNGYVIFTSFIGPKDLFENYHFEHTLLQELLCRELRTVFQDEISF